MCLAVYKGHLAAEQIRMSSACFNRELQNHLHTCPSNHMHRHRGKTGPTFYWARAQGGSFVCCRLFGNFIKLHVYKKTTNQFTKSTLALSDARWCHCQTSNHHWQRIPKGPKLSRLGHHPVQEITVFHYLFLCMNPGPLGLQRQ